MLESIEFARVPLPYKSKSKVNRNEASKKGGKIPSSSVNQVICLSKQTCIHKWFNKKEKKIKIKFPEKKSPQRHLKRRWN